MVLDGILTVVDSKHIIGQLQEEQGEERVGEECSDRRTIVQMRRTSQKVQSMRQ